MKQLLFLLLFPCLALAQYTGNAGQKITLGEQTTADGLVFRGLAADTTRKPSVDTMAYILLDTNTNIIWQYKKATNNAWTRVGGSISSGVTGVLPVENGGTNRTTMPAGYILHGDGTSVDTAIGLFWNRNARKLGVGTSAPDWQLSIVGQNQQLLTMESYSDTYSDYQGEPGILLSKSASNTVGTKTTTRNNENLGAIAFNGVRNDNTVRTAAFIRVVQSGNAGDENIPAKFSLYTSDGTNSAAERITIASSGAVTIANLAGTGSRTVLADANGVLSAPVSSITTKENVQTLNYGLNEILQINPVSFDYINKDKWGDERNLGFIIEDMFPVVPEVTGTMNNGDMYLDMTKLIPILTKAIQEQNALIKALEQRILILENK